MKSILYLFILFGIFSCDSKKISYEYNGVTLNRLDKNNESLLYYGENISADSYIKIKHNKSGMLGYIKFNNDKTIDVCALSEGFEKIGNDSLLNLTLDYFSFSLTNVLDTITEHQKDQNVILISDNYSLEKYKNEKRESLVVSNYLP